MFNEGSGQYWNAVNSATGASAISYIPETVWNEQSLTGGAKSVSGGGASVLYSKPAWQSAPGVPQDGARDVPDIAFNAAMAHDPDVGAYNGQLSANSGTSVAAPAFAGVLALLNQRLASNGSIAQPGLGNVNPGLYRLARTVPSTFHDITTGNNLRPCSPGTPDCVNGTLRYSAGLGYDLATGLGSIDVNMLVTQWNTARAPSATTLSAGAASVPLNGSAPLTIAVTAPAGFPAPTGSVAINVGMQAIGTVQLTVAGTASFTLYGSQLSAGAATVTAIYSGDANLDGSAANVTIQALAPAGGSAVIPAVSPNPVPQHTQADANGNTLFFTLTLTESAGVATTLTSMTVDGASQPLSPYFPSTAIPANGAISAVIATAAAPGVASRVYGFTGTDVSGLSWHQEVTAFFIGSQLLAISGIANAASGDTSGLSPGAIASVYGGGLSPYLLQATSVPLPLSLGGVSAQVNGYPAPLYFVSPTQVNLQIPYEVTSESATIIINNNGQLSSTSPYASIPVNVVTPGIFVDANGNTVPYASGARGQTLTLFITGFGAVTPAVADGAAPTTGTPVSQLPQPVANLNVFIGGEKAPVTFTGIPPGLVGVMQVNFQVPTDALLGPQPVVVTLGIVHSAAATLTVTQ